MEQLKQIVHEFLAERGCEEQYKMPKDLALSLTLEASELLECFQWKTDNEALSENKAEILEELADVFIYATQMAVAMDVNIDEIVKAKLVKNATKYPAKST
ncbi:nucleotide pyrophosphohydrolase [Listeria weihenstephanensis]|uniref:Nucleotide pyrophosphohydrolase n=1 Tax=Listeria weihenstephanensis TaxID=1006155 RepID=A0A841ZBM5_9LIST|nr:nucleotide pyrophosphohydrolase [Listeria weihenstephanensis]MBC1501916.1 nucleotide pyrophosphohydrolase [Listeria weihenstephanensis]